MKKYDIYFVGSNSSIVSSIFLNSLISFSNKNLEYKLKYIIDTDPNLSFVKKAIVNKLKNKIKTIIYFFFNKKYYNLNKIINYEYEQKKDIIFQAKFNNIDYKKFSDFNEKIKKKKSILVNCGGIKIFKFFFLNKFDICINYHHAEIPRFRGTYSNSFSLFYNKFYTYFSLHYINSKIDKGYVFYKDKVKIDKNIKHNLYYEIAKIKKASKNINTIFKQANKKKKYKNLSLRKGTYYPLNYYKNLFLKINKFSYKQIQKYIEIFGGFYYMNNFITRVKKNKKGIQLKDSKIKVVEIKYMPVFLYRFLRVFSFVKP